MKKVIAKDSLPIHFTSVDTVYEVHSEDEECYKILDDRGRFNWVPKRYFLEYEVSDLEGDD